MNLAILGQAAETVLEAAVDPCRWNAAVDEIASAAGAIGAVAIPIQGSTPDLPISASLHDQMRAYFRDGWNVAEFRTRGVPKMRQSGIMVDQDFTSQEEMSKEPYYQEFLRPVGLQWFAGIGFRAEEDVWCLAIQRSPEQGPFNPAEQRELLRLGPHLSSAATLGRLLSRARVEGMLDAFELAGTGFALLDRSGRVVRLNARAERLLTGAFHFQKGELIPLHRASTPHFKQHVAVAVGETGEVVQPLSPLVIPRRDSRPLLVRATPLRGAGLSYFSPGRAILSFIELGERCPAPEGLVRRFFGLTHAESRLIALLADGFTLREAAERLEVSVGTARSQLKSTFAKTGFSRQSELLSFITELLIKAPNQG